MNVILCAFGHVANSHDAQIEIVISSRNILDIIQCFYGTSLVTEGLGHSRKSGMKGQGSEWQKVKRTTYRSPTEDSSWRRLNK